MASDKNPQAEQMVHESMVRNLRAQAEAIWPQEEPLLRALGLPPKLRALDVACGTGEITDRLADLFAEAELVGIDIHADHLELARDLCARHGERVSFHVGDAYGIEFESESFDLTLCRHLLQAIPHPERVLAELVRVTRPGGIVYLVLEDYGMMHFHPVKGDPDRFWREGPVTFARETGTDLLVGRKGFTLARQAGLEDVTVEYITIDTTRVSRELFSEIWCAWRDGYSSAIARETSFSEHEVRAAFEDMIAAIRDPDGYAIWQLPVVIGRRPSA